MPHPKAAELHITEQKFNLNNEPIGYCEINATDPEWVNITIWASGAGSADNNVRYLSNRAFAHRILRGLALLEAQEAASESK